MYIYIYKHIYIDNYACIYKYTHIHIVHVIVYEDTHMLHTQKLLGYLAARTSFALEDCT